MPKDVIAHMIQVGIENGDINKELPLDYVSMEIASRVLIYIIYITDDDKNGCSRQQMHKLVCDAMRKALK